MQHPNDRTLALFAGRDLGFLGRWHTSRHVENCERCQREVDLYAAAAAGAEELSELPNLAWNRLAAEMKANIRLGLAAGECVRQPRAAGIFALSRYAAAYAAVAAVLAAGVFLQRPAPRDSVQDGIRLATVANGIEVREGGHGMALLHTRARDVVYSVGAQGSVRARYVDAETGQVTINNVYAQ